MFLRFPECKKNLTFKKIEKDIKIKGKKDSKILTFDDFYLELKE